MRFLLIGLLWLLANAATAQDSDVVLEKYIADDVVAIAYVDVAKVKLSEMIDWTVGLGIVPADEAEVMKQASSKIQENLERFIATGGSDIYLLFRLSDVEHGGPSWVVPLEEGRDTTAVMKELFVMGKMLSFFGQGRFSVDGGTVLGASTMAQLEQLKTARPTEKRDLNDAWQALGQGHCGLIIFGDKDSRRVVREMFPKLPAPFETIDGSLLADGLQWGGVAIDFPPKLDAKVLIEASDERAATTLQESLTLGVSLLQLMPEFHQFLEADDRSAVLVMLTPKVSGKRLSIQSGEMTRDVERLTKLLGPPIRKARQASIRSTRMNDFKQIGLGMLNFESANNSFPAKAICDDEGKPLLSWRVQILPYLEQSALYNQFHLDEPWDSEHNRKLIAKMPEIYADPDSVFRKLKAIGKTTYVVPSGLGTLFHGQQGFTFKELVDGLSNTILLVEVVPERAVIWTKPDDWEVDFEKPWDGVRREDRDWFTAGFCDGHVEIIPHSYENLGGLITPAGGEIIKSP